MSKERMQQDAARLFQPKPRFFAPRPETVYATRGGPRKEDIPLFRSRWTAEMVLIFSLGRLDMLPVDDFGLHAGVKEEYGLEELPGRAALRKLGEPWRPYRSIATWYLWRSRGGVPQSED